MIRLAAILGVFAMSASISLAANWQELGKSSTSPVVRPTINSLSGECGPGEKCGKSCCDKGVAACCAVATEAPKAAPAKGVSDKNRRI